MSALFRLLAALFIAIFSLFGYCSNTSPNPVTGEKQRVSITPQQEVALGQQAAGRMIQDHGGLLQSEKAQREFDRLGHQLTTDFREALPYEYDFHLLADTEVVNAFALPGGQVFLTRALLDQIETEDQLAAILSHEIAHVLARHSAERLAKAKLQQGLTGAAVLASYDPSDPGSLDNAKLALMVGQLVNMKHGRDDEIEADLLGVDIMMSQGFDPQGMVEVMSILEESSSGPRVPEFASTHPSPKSRIKRIERYIEEQKNASVSQ